MITVDVIIAMGRTENTTARPPHAAGSSGLTFLLCIGESPMALLEVTTIVEVLI